MISISKDNAPTPQKNNLRGLVVCQIFGLAAMAFVIFTITNQQYRALAFAVVIIPMILFIPRPGLILYVFILCFFTNGSIYHNGWMLSVKPADIIFPLLILAFISSKRTQIVKAALEKQCTLFIALCVFALWAIVGYIVNFYNHTSFVNFTSAFFVFQIILLLAAVILFSQPQWQEYREKIIVFFLICVFFEILIAVALEIFSGARTLYDFHKLTGTVGPHHAMLGNILILSFGVAAGAYFEMRDKYVKMFASCVAVLCLALIIVSGSRSIILGLILAIPAVLLIGSQNRWCKLGIAVVPIAAIFTVLSVPIFGDTVFNTFIVPNPDDIDLSSYGRLLIWERVYEYAQYSSWQQKIFGIGIGTFNTMPFDYYLEVGTFTTGAHNNFLHVFVETGIVGFILYMVIFVNIVQKLAIRSRLKDKTAKSFLFCTLALLFSCLTQETFWFNNSFGRFWLMYMFFYLILFNFSTNLPKEHKI